MKPSLTFLTAILLVSSAVLPAAGDDAVAIGTRLEPMVDTAILAGMNGAADLQMHHPVPREVALTHDAGWEGGSAGYHTVFHDGERYRMYYYASSLFTVEPSVGGKAKLVGGPSVLCYAESEDGIHWKKPALGLHDYHGSKENNIILTTGTWDDLLLRPEMVAIGLNGHPAAKADARYLGSFFCYSREGRWVDGKYKTTAGGLGICTSADGIHWKPLVDGPVLIDGPSDGKWDSQNQIFWDPARGTYRAYWRGRTPEGIRTIRTATSPDLLTWTGHRDLDYGDAPLEQLYTNVVMPWPGAPHVLLALPVRYVERRPGSSLDALPDAAARRLRMRAEERFGTGITDSVLMTSRDGEHFKRWAESFLRPGPERPGTWQYGQQYIARGLVTTKPDLPGAADEYSLYATENHWTSEAHWSPHVSLLRRYTIRRDGFVSLSAPMSGGEAVTKLLRFQGKHLVINFATSAAGAIRFELQDAAGKPLPGFSLDDCDDVYGDSTARIVRWTGGDDLSRLAGTPVRLRIALKDADLFTLQFRDALK